MFDSLKLWHLSDWIEENLKRINNWLGIKGEQRQQHASAPTRLGCVAKHFRKQRGHVLNPPSAQQCCTA